MENNWNGCRASSRLNLWFDDEMYQNWVVSGKDDYVAATGSPAELVRMAVAILEHMPDTAENGPPLGLSEEQEALPSSAADLITQAVKMTLDPPEEMSPETWTRLAGGLMAAAVHILGTQATDTWTNCRTSRFPFRMMLDEDSYWDKRGLPPT